MIEYLPKTLLKFFQYFTKKQWKALLLMQLFFFGWSLDNTVWPYAFKLMIEKLNHYQGDRLLAWHTLAPVLMFWLSSWIIISLMFRLGGIMCAKALPEFEKNIRMAMFKYVEQHSYHYFSDHFSGKTAKKIDLMTKGLSLILQKVTVTFIPAALTVVITTTLFFSIHAGFACLLLIWLFIHLSICFYSGKKAQILSAKHAQKRSLLSGKIIDTLTNIINVKSFAQENFEYDHCLEAQKEEQKTQYSSLFFIEKTRLLLDIAAFLIMGILMNWMLIHAWQMHHINTATVVMIFTLLWNITFVAWIAGTELPNLFSEIGICQEALSIIKAPHDIKDAPDAKLLQVTRGEIVFEKITFRYSKNSQVFENKSANIPAGTKVGLVGFSGSGKSTFVNLIMRFFEIESGKILIDGQNIQEVTRESLRQQISMIAQEPSLFHRSLLDNIRYGKPEASEEEIIAAAKQAYCHDFIMELPEKYKTLVGERGVKLSGGQRQRVSIARAFLKNAPILILDEATSALDSITERYIQNSLAKLMENKTTIIVAHRLSTLLGMDRILVFDNGEIIEDGKHEDLLAQDGHYAKLWSMQANGFLPTVKP